MVRTIFHRCNESSCRRGSGKRLLSRSGFLASYLSVRKFVLILSSYGSSSFRTLLDPEEPLTDVPKVGAVRSYAFALTIE